MDLYPSDVRYAHLQLGLDEPSMPEHTNDVLLFARSYRYFTKARIAHITRFVDFLCMRQKFGSLSITFAEIRRIYHMRAMVLHPDLNRSNKAVEDQLKVFNVAYAIVENIYRESQNFFKENKSFQERVRQEALQQTLRENPSRTPSPAAEAGVQASFSRSSTDATRKSPDRETHTNARAHTTASQARRYIAASVPRYIRTSRLFYLPRDSIIGSKLIKPGDSLGTVYDIIMLPENEFLRARHSLGSEGMGAPALRLSGLMPAYIPIDRKQFFVPLTEKDPKGFAKAHFLKEFGLSDQVS